ncbi:cysteine-rich venom protein pseudechetoxin-like [Paramacrobiotus metropolitanus]|uniref:cysteine-rich venom protein pseudechetoxin-like n=1 Tax=Paramacrobiotus metropolitanus TaxID=2943436 RepID=UPI002446447C|nr:cysteine-rich venom protein pseudechetoxin-like [Paramacrobiotus metropolitanus]
MQNLVVLVLMMTFGCLQGQTVVDTSVASVQKAILDQHNNARREKPSTGMLKLSWDAETADRAQAWANKCNYAHPVQGSSDYNTYMKTSKYTLGQNIAKSSNVMSWSGIINLWYNEINSFTLGQSTTATVGHYTQIMWNTTFFLGCGYKNCGSFHFYVCDYAPAGNVVPRQYSPYEAGKACAKCPTACDNGLCTNPCTYTNQYCNCERTCQGSNALFPKGCANAASFLQSFKQYCAATCNCFGTKLYD